MRWVTDSTAAPESNGVEMPVRENSAGQKKAESSMGLASLQDQGRSIFTPFLNPRIN
jgi:hypothetical protein